MASVKAGRANSTMHARATDRAPHTVCNLWLRELRGIFRWLTLTHLRKTMPENATQLTRFGASALMDSRSSRCN